MHRLNDRNMARTALFGMLALCVLGAPLMGQADGEASELLDTERWRENKYGISFQPPLDSKLFRHTADEQIVRIAGNDPEYELTIDVKRSKRALTMEEIVAAARKQHDAMHPDAKLLGTRSIEVAELESRQLSYRIPVPARQTDALLEQVLVQADPMTLVLVEMRGAYRDAERTRAVLDAVLGTLEIADQAELAKARREAVARTEKWRETVTEDQLKAAASGTSYFRVVDGERDIGWMEVERKSGQWNQETGVAVVITSHLRLGRMRVDSEGRYFRPYSGPVGETWTVKTTYRPANRRAEPRTAVETGTVTDDHIEVRIDANTGEKNDKLQFRRRPIGYMAQADGWLLGRLLPHEAATTYGFYWYNRRQQKVTFRSDKVTPALDGFTITSRLSPDGPALTASYDRQGRLQRKDLGGGRRLIRSDAAELRQRWQTRP